MKHSSNRRSCVALITAIGWTLLNPCPTLASNCENNPNLKIEELQQCFKDGVKPNGQELMGWTSGKCFQSSSWKDFWYPSLLIIEPSHSEADKLRIMLMENVGADPDYFSNLTREERQAVYNVYSAAHWNPSYMRDLSELQESFVSLLDSEGVPHILIRKNGASWILLYGNWVGQPEIDTYCIYSMKI